MTPVKAIRMYCLECSGQSPKEVKECSISDCPLFKFRLGKNPNRKGCRPNAYSFEKNSHSTQLIL